MKCAINQIASIYFIEVNVMQSCELVTFITAVACSISKCCAKEELPVIAATFTQLGDTIATIIAQEEACGKDVEK